MARRTDVRARSRLACVLFLMAALVSMVARSALADWPMSRHDSRRTGSSPGTSDIKTPIPYWRAYLGGRVAANELIPYDIDGNGSVDFVSLEGGRLIARKATGEVIWKTPLLSLSFLYGIEDFDGDGKFEVL